MRPKLLSSLSIIVMLASTPVFAVRKSDHVNYADRPGASFHTPPPDRAMVVFMRPSKKGHGISSIVYDEDTFLAVVMSETHVVYLTNPGRHRFMIVSEAADFLDADLEGGKIYYALVQARMGAWKARFSLFPFTPRHEEWGKLEEWLAESYEVTSNESGSRWAREHADSVKAKKDAYLVKWLEKPQPPALEKADGVTRP